MTYPNALKGNVKRCANAQLWQNGTFASAARHLVELNGSLAVNYIRVLLK